MFVCCTNLALLRESFADFDCGFTTETTSRRLYKREFDKYSGRTRFRLKSP